MIDAPREPAAFAPARRLFWGAVVIATIQMSLAARLAAATADYSLSVTAAWVAVLFRLWEKPALAPRSGIVSRVLGCAALAAGLFALARVPAYRAPDRLLPLLAGLGLFVIGSGPRAWLHRRTELLLLALPVINPIPEPIRDAIGPTNLTTWFAMEMDRAAGYPMTADGNILSMPGGILDVVSGCSGATSISRLLVLAILIVALFPTNGRQRWALFAGATVVGFFANAARVAIMGAAMAQGEEGRYDYWHDGLGATVFSIVSTAAAGIAWWLALALLAPSPGRQARSVAAPSAGVSNS